MSGLASSSSQLTGAQILARLNALEASTIRDVNAAVPNNTQTIQQIRRAQGWCVPASVTVARYTLAR